jgi:hypothetical protein
MRTVFRVIICFMLTYGCYWLFKKTNFPNRLLGDNIKNNKYFKLFIFVILTVGLLLSDKILDISIFSEHYYIASIVYGLSSGMVIALTLNIFHNENT